MCNDHGYALSKLTVMDHMRIKKMIFAEYDPEEGHVLSMEQDPALLEVDPVIPIA